MDDCQIIKLTLNKMNRKKLIIQTIFCLYINLFFRAFSTASSLE